jgi:hypothetical protein
MRGRLLESWFVGLFVAEAFGLYASTLLAAKMVKDIGEGMMGRRTCRAGFVAVGRKRGVTISFHSTLILTTARSSEIALSGCLETQISEKFPTKILGLRGK